MLPELFPNIERRNEQLAKSIMFEVVDLPRNTPGNELEYKVSRGVMCIYSTTICIVCSVCVCLFSVYIKISYLNSLPTTTTATTVGELRRPHGAADGLLRRGTPTRP